MKQIHPRNCKQIVQFECDVNSHANELTNHTQQMLNKSALIQLWSKNYETNCFQIVIKSL